MTVYGLYSEGGTLRSSAEAETAQEAAGVFKARKVIAKDGRVRKLAEPEVAVYTGGKVSKAKGVSVAVAVIEGLSEGPVTVTTTHRPNHPTPNSVAFEGLMLGVGAALSKGATSLRVYSASKNAVKSVDGTGGAKYETRRDAYLSAYVTTWLSRVAEAEGVYLVSHREAKDMPQVAEAAAGALKGAGAALAPDDELTLV